MLICDFMQYYGVADIYGLDAVFAATLAAGLPMSSRAMMKISGATVPPAELLLAMAVDALNISNWMRTKDGQKHRNRPQSIVKLLTQGRKQNEVRSFGSASEFEARRTAIIRNAHKKDP